MDVKRLLLVIPLAVLAYLLVVQWNKDYGQTAVETQAPAYSQSNNGQSNNGQSNSGDTDTDSVANTEQGLAAPTGSAQKPSGNPGMADSDQDGNRRSLIEVVTDTLDVRIDPRGGDIVYAALPQHKMSKDAERPFVLLSDGQTRSYVAKSGLQLEGHQGRISFETEKTRYTLAEGQDALTVDLHATVNGVEVIKRMTFERDSYAVDVSYHLANKSETPVTARFIGQLARDNSADPSSGSGVGMSSYLGAAYSSPDNHYEKIDFETIQEGQFNNRDVQGGWTAIIQHYFTSAWVPEDNQQNLYYATTDSRDRNVVAFASPTQTLAPGGESALEATLYMGPKVQERLEEVAPNLELTVDFGWLWFLANPLFWLLDKIHDVLGNWGWSIVVLTVIVKTVLFPLSATAYKSMAKMRKLGPEMKRIKEQYGSDRQKMSQEMMKFYQKEKINPLGGCLPIIIQMPVFIALYWMLMESVELRHAPFMLWIDDLSVKDPLFVLPIIMGLTMFVQQQLNPAPPDPTQAKIMKMLPIVFTFFFLWFPAGLVVYWIVNNSISILQQWIITRRIAGDPAPAKGK